MLIEDKFIARSHLCNIFEINSGKGELIYVWLKKVRLGKEVEVS
jgi:hypothetical protein